jgi:hypothetical protein
VFTPAANTLPTPTRPAHDATPTNSVGLAFPTEDSPGGQSSRQSNDPNGSVEHLDAATSEGHTTEVEPANHSAAGKHFGFQIISSYIQ